MKTLFFRATQVKFPDACVVCRGSARQQYNFERTITYGRSSILLSLPVPLCQKHYQQVASKTRSQTWCERISLAVGAATGAAVCAGLLWYWAASAQGALISNILLALFVGLSFAVIIWAIGYFWIAGLFKSPEASAVLRHMQIKSFDPFRQVLELVFANDIAAELTARENLPLLILEQENLRPYRISAHILDHNIRYNNTIHTQVLFDHFPTEKEALTLLQPVIDKVMVQQMAEGTFYDIDCIEIAVIPR